jgi:hypothetical protein
MMLPVPPLDRWPLLLAAALCILGAIWLYKTTGNPDDGRGAAVLLVVFAAFLLGAFVADWARLEHNANHHHNQQQEE